MEAIDAANANGEGFAALSSVNLSLSASQKSQRSTKFNENEEANAEPNQYTSTATAPPLPTYARIVVPATEGAEERSNTKGGSQALSPAVTANSRSKTGDRLQVASPKKVERSSYSTSPTRNATKNVLAENETHQGNKPAVDKKRLAVKTSMTRAPRSRPSQIFHVAVNLDREDITAVLRREASRGGEKTLAMMSAVGDLDLMTEATGSSHEQQASAPAFVHGHGRGEENEGGLDTDTDNDTIYVEKKTALSGKEESTKETEHKMAQKKTREDKSSSDGRGQGGFDVTTAAQIGVASFSWRPLPNELGIPGEDPCVERSCRPKELPQTRRPAPSTSTSATAMQSGVVSTAVIPPNPRNILNKGGTSRNAFTTTFTTGTTSSMAMGSTARRSLLKTAMDGLNLNRKGEAGLSFSEAKAAPSRNSAGSRGADRLATATTSRENVSQAKKEPRGRSASPPLSTDTKGTVTPFRSNENNNNNNNSGRMVHSARREHVSPSRNPHRIVANAKDASLREISSDLLLRSLATSNTALRSASLLASALPKGSLFAPESGNINTSSNLGGGFSIRKPHSVLTEDTKDQESKETETARKWRQLITVRLTEARKEAIEAELYGPSAASSSSRKKMLSNRNKKERRDWYYLKRERPSLRKEEIDMLYALIPSPSGSEESSSSSSSSSCSASPGSGSESGSTCTSRPAIAIDHEDGGKSDGQTFITEANETEDVSKQKVSSGPQHRHSHTHASSLPHDYYYTHRRAERKKARETRGGGGGALEGGDVSTMASSDNISIHDYHHHHGSNKKQLRRNPKRLQKDWEGYFIDRDGVRLTPDEVFHHRADRLLRYVRHKKRRADEILKSMPASMRQRLAGNASTIGSEEGEASRVETDEVWKELREKLEKKRRFGDDGSDGDGHGGLEDAKERTMVATVDEILKTFSEALLSEDDSESDERGGTIDKKEEKGTLTGGADLSTIGNNNNNNSQKKRRNGGEGKSHRSRRVRFSTEAREFLNLGPRKGQMTSETATSNYNTILRVLGDPDYDFRRHYELHNHDGSKYLSPELRAEVDRDRGSGGVRDDGGDLFDSLFNGGGANRNSKRRRRRRRDGGVGAEAGASTSSEEAEISEARGEERGGGLYVSRSRDDDSPRRGSSAKNGYDADGFFLVTTSSSDGSSVPSDDGASDSTSGSYHTSDFSSSSDENAASSSVSSRSLSTNKKAGAASEDDDDDGKNTDDDIENEELDAYAIAQRREKRRVRRARRQHQRKERRRAKRRDQRTRRRARKRARRIAEGKVRPPSTDDDARKNRDKYNEYYQHGYNSGGEEWGDNSLWADDSFMKNRGIAGMSKPLINTGLSAEDRKRSRRRRMSRKRSLRLIEGYTSSMGGEDGDANNTNNGAGLLQRRVSLARGLGDEEDGTSKYNIEYEGGTKTSSMGSPSQPKERGVAASSAQNAEEVRFAARLRLLAEREMAEAKSLAKSLSSTPLVGGDEAGGGGSKGVLLGKGTLRRTVSSGFGVATGASRGGSNSSNSVPTYHQHRGGGGVAGVGGLGLGRTASQRALFACDVHQGVRVEVMELFDGVFWGDDEAFELASESPDDQLDIIGGIPAAMSRHGSNRQAQGGGGGGEYQGSLPSSASSSVASFYKPPLPGAQRLASAGSAPRPPPTVVSFGIHLNNTSDEEVGMVLDLDHLNGLFTIAEFYNGAGYDDRDGIGHDSGNNANNSNTWRGKNGGGIKSQRPLKIKVRAPARTRLEVARVVEPPSSDSSCAQQAGQKSEGRDGNTNNNENDRNTPTTAMSASEGNKKGSSKKLPPEAKASGEVDARKRSRSAYIELFSSVKGTITTAKGGTVPLVVRNVTVAPPSKPTPLVSITTTTAAAASTKKSTLDAPTNKNTKSGSNIQTEPVSASVLSGSGGAPPTSGNNLGHLSVAPLSSPTSFNARRKTPSLFEQTTPFPSEGAFFPSAAAASDVMRPSISSSSLPSLSPRGSSAGGQLHRPASGSVKSLLAGSVDVTNGAATITIGPIGRSHRGAKGSAGGKGKRGGEGGVEDEGGDGTSGGLLSPPSPRRATNVPKPPSRLLNMNKSGGKTASQPPKKQNKAAAPSSQKGAEGSPRGEQTAVARQKAGPTPRRRGKKGRGASDGEISENTSNDATRRRSHTAENDDGQNDSGELLPSSLSLPQSAAPLPPSTYEHPPTRAPSVADDNTGDATIEIPTLMLMTPTEGNENGGSFATSAAPHDEETTHVCDDSRSDNKPSSFALEETNTTTTTTAINDITHHQEALVLAESETNNTIPPPPPQTDPSSVGAVGEGGGAADEDAYYFLGSPTIATPHFKRGGRHTFTMFSTFKEWPSADGWTYHRVGSHDALTITRPWALLRQASRSKSFRSGRKGAGGGVDSGKGEGGFSPENQRSKGNFSSFSFSVKSSGSRGGALGAGSKANLKGGGTAARGGGGGGQSEVGDGESPSSTMRDDLPSFSLSSSSRKKSRRGNKGEEGEGESLTFFGSDTNDASLTPSSSSKEKGRGGTNRQSSSYNKVSTKRSDNSSQILSFDEDGTERGFEMSESKSFSADEDAEENETKSLRYKHDRGSLRSQSNSRSFGGKQETLTGGEGEKEGAADLIDKPPQHKDSHSASQRKRSSNSKSGQDGEGGGGGQGEGVLLLLRNVESEGECSTDEGGSSDQGHGLGGLQPKPQQHSVVSGKSYSASTGKPEEKQREQQSSNGHTDSKASAYSTDRDPALVTAQDNKPHKVATTKKVKIDTIVPSSPTASFSKAPSSESSSSAKVSHRPAFGSSSSREAPLHSNPLWVSKGTGGEGAGELYAPPDEWPQKDGAAASGKAVFGSSVPFRFPAPPPPPPLSPTSQSVSPGLNLASTPFKISSVSRLSAKEQEKERQRRERRAMFKEREAMALAAIRAQDTTILIKLPPSGPSAYRTSTATSSDGTSSHGHVGLLIANSASISSSSPTCTALTMKAPPSDDPFASRAILEQLQTKRQGPLPNGGNSSVYSFSNTTKEKSPPAFMVEGRGGEGSSAFSRYLSAFPTLSQLVHASALANASSSSSPLGDDEEARAASIQRAVLAAYIQYRRQQQQQQQQHSRFNSSSPNASINLYPHPHVSLPSEFDPLLASGGDLDDPMFYAEVMAQLEARLLIASSSPAAQHKHKGTVEGGQLSLAAVGGDEDDDGETEEEDDDEDEDGDTLMLLPFTGGTKTIVSKINTTSTANAQPNNDCSRSSDGPNRARGRGHPLPSPPPLLPLLLPRNGRRLSSSSSAAHRQSHNVDESNENKVEEKAKKRDTFSSFSLCLKGVTSTNIRTCSRDDSEYDKEEKRAGGSRTTHEEDHQEDTSSSSSPSLLLLQLNANGHHHATRRAKASIVEGAVAKINAAMMRRAPAWEQKNAFVYALLEAATCVDSSGNSSPIQPQKTKTMLDKLTDYLLVSSSSASSSQPKENEKQKQKGFSAKRKKSIDSGNAPEKDVEGKKKQEEQGAEGQQEGRIVEEETPLLSTVLDCLAEAGMDDDDDTKKDTKQDAQKEEVHIGSARSFARKLIEESVLSLPLPPPRGADPSINTLTTTKDDIDERLFFVDQCKELITHHPRLYDEVISDMADLIVGKVSAAATRGDDFWRRVVFFSNNGRGGNDDDNDDREESSQMRSTSESRRSSRKAVQHEQPKEGHPIIAAKAQGEEKGAERENEVMGHEIRGQHQQPLNSLRKASLPSLISNNSNNTTGRPSSSSSSAAVVTPLPPLFVKTSRLSVPLASAIPLIPSGNDDKTSTNINIKLSTANDAESRSNPEEGDNNKNDEDNKTPTTARLIANANALLQEEARLRRAADEWAFEVSKKKQVDPSFASALEVKESIARRVVAAVTQQIRARRQVNLEQLIALMHVSLSRSAGTGRSIGSVGSGPHHSGGVEGVGRSHANSGERRGSEEGWFPHYLDDNVYVLGGAREERTGRPDENAGASGGGGCQAGNDDSLKSDLLEHVEEKVKDFTNDNTLLSSGVGGGATRGDSNVPISNAQLIEAAPLRFPPPPHRPQHHYVLYKGCGYAYGRHKKARAVAAAVAAALGVVLGGSEAAVAFQQEGSATAAATLVAAPPVSRSTNELYDESAAFFAVDDDGPASLLGTDSSKAAHDQQYVRPSGRVQFNFTTGPVAKQGRLKSLYEGNSTIGSSGGGAMSALLVTGMRGSSPPKSTTAMPNTNTITKSKGMLLSAQQPLSPPPHPPKGGAPLSTSASPAAKRLLMRSNK